MLKSLQSYDLRSSTEIEARSLLGTGSVHDVSDTNNLQIRREVEKRKADNATACSILENHKSLWAQVGGRTPEKLLRPSLEDIEEARRCSEDIQELKAHDDRHGLPDCQRRVRFAPRFLIHVCSHPKYSQT